MKHFFCSFILFALACSFTTVYAQVPQGINYQAVVRDNAGTELSNQLVGIKVNIRQTSIGGNIVYSETFQVTTTQLGLVNFVIGQGTVVSGTFNAINWGAGPYFNEILLDAAGGSNYVSMGTAQLVSVPYALYAGTAYADHDTSATNELQTLTLTGNTIALSGSNSTILPFNTNNFKVKMNGTYITDPSINDVMLDSWNFLTENNYRYVMNASLSGSNRTDSFSIDGIYPYFTDTVYTWPFYVSTQNYSPGRIYRINGKLTTIVGLGYIPLNASPVTVNSLYQTVSFPPFWSSYSGSGQTFYAIYPHNPGVTGYGFNSLKVKVTYER